MIYKFEVTFCLFASVLFQPFYIPVSDGTVLFPGPKEQYIKSYMVSSEPYNKFISHQTFPAAFCRKMNNEIQQHQYPMSPLTIDVTL